MTVKKELIKIALMARREKNTPLHEIAKKFGVTVSYISTINRKLFSQSEKYYAVTDRRKQADIKKQRLRSEIIALYKDGLSGSEIAKRIGRSRQWINYILKKEGLIKSKAIGQSVENTLKG